MLSSSGAIAALIHQIYEDAKCYVNPKARRRRELKRLREELQIALATADLERVIALRSEIERVLEASRRDS